MSFCQLDTWEQTSVKFESKSNHFHPKKYQKNVCKINISHIFLWDVITHPIPQMPATATIEFSQVLWSSHHSHLLYRRVYPNIEQHTFSRLVCVLYTKQVLNKFRPWYYYSALFNKFQTMLVCYYAPVVLNCKSMHHLSSIFRCIRYDLSC